MEFDHLRGFYHVAKLGSFTAAASRLFVTQPAISLQVKALERELGEKLFDRVGRKIRLTHAGRVLYRHVAELISKLNEIHRTVGEIKNLERGRLDLGASDTTSMYFLPGLLKVFLRTHSSVDLTITSLISAQVVERVLDRQLDLGIVTLGETPEPLEAVPLFRQKLVLIASPDHPIACRKLVTAEEVAQEPMIALEKESLTQRQIDTFFREAGCRPRTVLELSNFEIIKCYVAAGLGVSLVPQAAVARSAGEVQAVSLRKPPSLGVGIVYRKDREFSQLGQAFLAMAQEHFRKRGAKAFSRPEKGPVASLS